MKKLKTRILKITYGDGRVRYLPQYMNGRLLFMPDWWDFSEEGRPYTLARENLKSRIEAVSSLDKAKAVIDAYIQLANSGTVVSEEVIKYP